MALASLRRRLSISLALAVTVLSLLFTVFTYFGVRHVEVTQRETSTLRQAYVNATLIRNAILSGSPALETVLDSLDSGTNASNMIYAHRAWIVSKLSSNHDKVPVDVQISATQGHVARRIFISNGEPVLAIGIPIPAINAIYFQLDHVSDLNRSLNLTLLVLSAAVGATILIGLLGGLVISRRITTPFARTAKTARDIAEGDFTQRITTGINNLEVKTLADSFNQMVDHLVERIERDARFSSDVSHELRSPLTTLATTIAIMQKDREALSVSSREALDLLSADVATFQILVEDLLEMAGNEAQGYFKEDVQLEMLLNQCLRSATARLHLATIPIIHETNVSSILVSVDRRRFERVITNLLDNARRYGGGAVAIRFRSSHNDVTIDVDDAGAGIGAEERQRVFERFYRGHAAHQRGAVRGTGLGLSLVAEHVQHFGGHVEILQSPEGGCRVRIVLPVLDEEALL